MRWWDEAAWTRLREWEYWPTFAFYWPMLLVGPWLALRARHPCFFTAANPGIYTGGMGLESKLETLRRIPAAWRPRTLLVEPGEPRAATLRRLGEAGIDFPLIAKPDIGYRGMAVRRVGSAEQLGAWLDRHPVPFLLQEFLDQPTELGILYYREPGAATGRVTSLTLKSFLAVTGDGRASVEDLMRGRSRARLQLERIRAEEPGLLAYVPEAGEEVPLGIVGNHSKGTAFFNGNERIDARLRARMDGIAGRIEGFCYGRFDIKCASLDDFVAGGAFRIIEVNGVCSEPTHMYDPARSSYWGALGAVIRHWGIVRRIAVENHRRGVAYLPPGVMWRALRQWRRYLRRLRP